MGKYCIFSTVGTAVLNNDESGEYMPRGKKTAPETIYAVIASWAVTKNYKETARQIGVAPSTVKKIIEEHKGKPEFEKVCTQKKDEFSKRADGIINKALNRLERDIDNEDKDIPVNHLTTVIGTLTDKKLLLEGKPTARTEIVGDDKLSKLAELAGYERKK